MKILVTGGAGYIGGFMAERLLNDGYDVVVVDNLEMGHRESVDKRASFIEGDLRDKSFVSELFHDHSFDAVLHFAAFISVAESMEDPGKYFENNIMASLNLLQAMQEKGVGKFIFSSTAGVYGNPTTIPIPEDHPKRPESPYGQSKLMVENILSWFQKQRGINSVTLRYFNAAGAALDGSRGEAHRSETHLIPNIINAALENRPFTLYGTDYDTPDGSCVRDYIHVLDLVEAHSLALKKLENDQGAFIYNVGTGKGYSNREVVETVKKISQKDVQVNEADNRSGDAATLVADPSKISAELSFTPKYSSLETIVEAAWKWHSRNTI